MRSCPRSARWIPCRLFSLLQGRERSSARPWYATRRRGVALPAPWPEPRTLRPAATRPARSPFSPRWAASTHLSSCLPRSRNARRHRRGSGAVGLDGGVSSAPSRARSSLSRARRATVHRAVDRAHRRGGLLHLLNAGIQRKLSATLDDLKRADGTHALVQGACSGTADCSPSLFLVDAPTGGRTRRCTRSLWPGHLADPMCRRAELLSALGDVEAS